MTATTAARRSPFHTLGVVLEMIKFEHTLFALPFAFLGMLLAARGWPSWWTVFWIVVAMVGARSAAMGFNRLVDRRIDAANPRTASRALPAGLVTPAAVAVFVAASAALLVLAAWRLNPLALALSPVALGILFLYSYTKRFTWGSHLVLGLSLSGAPLGAWIAVRGDVKATPLILAGAARPRLLVLGGLGRLPRPDRLPALGGAAGRPLAPERRFLHGQRRPVGLALRLDRP